MTDSETFGESPAGFRDNFQAALDERLIAQLHADARAEAEGKPIGRHYWRPLAPQSQS